MRLAPLNRFKHSSRSIFTDRSKAVLLLWIVFVSYACVCCAVVSVPCSVVVTYWERAALLAVVIVLLCRFPKCVLFHIRIKCEVDAVKLV